MTLTDQHAPARRRRATDSGRATGGAPVDANGASSTESSRRAYARRQHRRQRIAATTVTGAGASAAGGESPVTITRSPSSALDRAPFVAVVIALLGAGIAAVLWLNTMTDEAGMQTSTAKTTSSELRLSIEALRRDVATLDATSQIAKRAGELGLVPAGDSAMLVLDDSGTGVVVGEPSPVPGPPPPPPAPAATAPGSSTASSAAGADR